MPNRRYAWAQDASCIKVLVPDVVQNTRFSCGAAALHAVCAYWGVGMDNDLDYFPYLETNVRDGTMPENIVWYARHVGLRVREHHDMDFERLKEYLDGGVPVIVPLQAWGNPANYREGNGEGHYVVIIGYDEKRIYMEDPVLYCKHGYLTYKQFEERWHDVDAKGREFNRYGIAIWKYKPAYLLRAQKIG